MKKYILNGFIALLVIMNICVVMMICAGLRPKCFVDGCMCARIEGNCYCRKHKTYNKICNTDGTKDDEVDKTNYTARTQHTKYDISEYNISDIMAGNVDDSAVLYTITYTPAGKEICLKAKTKN